jgi:hypothetical protein
MVQIWDLLQQNDTIRPLEILHLPALRIASWREDPWATFLGRLRRLVVHLSGDCELDYAQLRTDAVYSAFLTSLDRYFFDHVVLLEELQLMADRHNPYGDCEYSPMGMAFRPDHMPALKHLRLQNCFLDTHCQDFLEAACRRGLETLELVECSGNVQTPSWAALFRRLSALGNDMHRKELVVAELMLTPARDEWTPPSGLDLTGMRQDPERGYVWSVAPLDTPLPWNDAKFLGGTIESRSGVSSDFEKPRPFASTRTDEEGSACPDHQHIVAEWADGADCKTYISLMRQVRSNRG